MVDAHNVCDGSDLSEDRFQEMRKELEDVSKYPLRTCAGMTLEGFAPLTYQEASKWLTSQCDHVRTSVGLWASARCQPRDLRGLLYRPESNEVRLYLEALRMDPRNAMAYYSLGCSVLNERAVTALPDGRNVYKKQLFLEAVRLKPSFVFAYNNLASCMNHLEKVELPSGQFTRRELYVEALQYGDNASVLNNLGACLAPDETIALRDGRVLSSRQLYESAIAIEPDNVIAYRNLAGLVPPGGLLTMSDGRQLSKRALLMQVLRCDPYSDVTYGRLCRLVEPKEPWSRATHPLYARTATNVLFATLLLGLQRLEDAGRLALGHHSVLEDALEGWTFADRHCPTDTPPRQSVY